jgi:hypothetical protein
MWRSGRLLLLTLLVLAASGAGRAAAAPEPQLLVGVAARGGLCPPSMCHWGGRITTTTITATDRRSRRLTRTERRALVLAIAQLRPASLPPFAGTCPIAYDGQERIYRFRGKPVLRSCTYDLRNVRAVQLADRLLASLPSR